MASSKGSDYPGVWKKDGYWSAHITIKGKQKHLGRYKIEEHAAMAYILAKLEAKQIDE